MLRISKKSEYGIIALKHMLNQPVNTVTSAKEIANYYNIPAEILAKILQIQARNGIVASSQGARGGYVLAKAGAKITLSEIIETVEGPLELVDCVSDDECDCGQMDTCNISEPIKIIQDQLKDFFAGISLADINNEIEIQKVVWQ
jgi:Rrf2 family protein